MIDGRLDPFGRWTWCALAFVFGLIFTQCAHALVFPTQSEALAQCQAKLGAIVSNQNWEVLEGECRHEPVPPLAGSPPTFGLYRCQVRTTTGSSWRVHMCGTTAGSLGSARCTSPDPDGCQLSNLPNATSITSGMPTSHAYYLWQEEDEPDQCADLEAFDTAAMGPAGGANGIRQVCYQGCVWDVFGGYYAGTYPAGYVYFTFEPLGYECSGEPEPGDPREGSDDPLDLDPEDGGVDPGPDPGDGDPSSSGGATCDQSPNCTGDSLQCNILFQTWAARCAAEAENAGLNEALEGISDGLDGVADGLDGIADGLSDLSDGISSVDQKLGGIRGFLEDVFGSGEQDVSGPIPGLGDLNTGNKVFDSDSLDQSGFGMPRSCPAILTDSVSFSFFGNSYEIRFDMLCGLLELVGQILVVLSAFVGVRILLRSVQ